jgi:integrase/recombinase XerD
VVGRNLAVSTARQGWRSAASRLKSTAGLKGRSFSTVFGLDAVTGLRVSEALALDREDVDLQQGILRIRRTKFGKCRLATVHESTRQVLANYASHKDRVVRRPATSAFFLAERGDRVKGGTTRHNFAQVSRKVGPRSATSNGGRGHSPRLHEMRHRFAVRTLLGWCRAGIDVEREMPKLTT